MINIKFNGQVISVQNSSNLSEILNKEFNIRGNKGIAVAVNMTVVPYSKWNEYLINNNDEIEIVHAVQGG